MLYFTAIIYYFNECFPVKIHVIEGSEMLLSHSNSRYSLIVSVHVHVAKF